MIILLLNYYKVWNILVLMIDVSANISDGMEGSQ